MNRRTQYVLGAFAALGWLFLCIVLLSGKNHGKGISVSPVSVPIEVSNRQYYNLYKAFAELAYYAELNGGYDCVVILEDVRAGETAKVKYRKFVKSAIMPPAIAKVSMRANTVASGGRRMDMEHAVQYVVVSSDLCKASFSFEPID